MIKFIYWIFICHFMSITNTVQNPDEIGASVDLKMLNKNGLIDFVSKHYRDERFLDRRILGYGPVDKNYGSIKVGAHVHPLIRNSDAGIDVSFDDICGFMKPSDVSRQHLFNANTQGLVGFLYQEKGLINYQQHMTIDQNLRANTFPVQIPYEALAICFFRQLGGISSDEFTAPNRIRPHMTRVIAEDTGKGLAFISRKDTVFFIEPGFIRCKYAGNTEKYIPTDKFKQEKLVTAEVHHTLGQSKPIRHYFASFLPAGPTKFDSL